MLMEITHAQIMPLEALDSNIARALKFQGRQAPSQALALPRNSSHSTSGFVGLRSLPNSPDEKQLHASEKALVLKAKGEQETVLKLIPGKCHVAMNVETYSHPQRTRISAKVRISAAYLSQFSFDFSSTIRSSNRT